MHPGITAVRGTIVNVGPECDHVPVSDLGGDGLFTATAVGIGGFFLIRKWVQYRRRAVNPDMVDPAPSYRLRWNLALGALTVAIVILAVAVAGAWEGLGLFRRPCCWSWQLLAPASGISSSGWPLRTAVTLPVT